MQTGIMVRSWGVLVKCHSPEETSQQECLIQASIRAIGTELLLATIANSNSKWRIDSNNIHNAWGIHKAHNYWIGQ